MPRSRAANTRHQERTESILARHFPDFHWQQEVTIGDLAVDLAGARTTSPTSRILVELQRIRPARYPQIEGAMAKAKVIIGSVAGATDKLLVSIEVPRATAKMADHVASFTSRYMPNLDWLLIGDDGAIRGSIAGQRVDDPAATEPLQRAPVPRSGETRGIFTANNQYLAKCLLLQDHGPRIWRGPSTEPPYRTSLEFSRAVDVPQSAAYRFINTFRAEGYVSKQHGRLRVVRPEALLRDWLAEASRARPDRYHLRSIYGDDFDAERLSEMARAAGYYIVVAGYESCRLNGWLHTISPGLEVHLGAEHDVARFADRLDLEFCPHAQASLTVLPANAPNSEARSIWNCSLWPSGHGGPWLADALQAALDCAVHKARGTEQAEHIIRNVLGFSEY